MSNVHSTKVIASSIDKFIQQVFHGKIAFRNPTDAKESMLVGKEENRSGKKLKNA